MNRVLLLTDGSSDRALIHPLRWLFEQHGESPEFTWADLSVGPKVKLRKDRIKVALSRYTCEILLIHRDSENEPAAKRRNEIAEVMQSQRTYLPVIPVRMSEAWLLFNEGAIRTVAGNPNGREPLELPKWDDKVERLTDPKQMLHQALRQASGLAGRRRADFEVHPASHRLAQIIPTYEPLRKLSSFKILERQLIELLGIGEIDIE